jgi:hypothetical protein
LNRKTNRLSWDGAARVTFELKTPWRDGTTHLEMTPIDFMERLAALVPRPRLHLIRFHGVLAPNAKLRAMVVPQSPGSARPRLDNLLLDFTPRNAAEATDQGIDAAVLQLVNAPEDVRLGRYAPEAARRLFGWRG